MNRKLLQQKIEEILHSRQLVFKTEKDNKKEQTFIHFFPENLDHVLCELEHPEIYIAIYKNYVIFHVLGWETIEKVDNPEDIPFLNLFKILDSFLDKKMKIRISLSRNKPYEWKIFLLHKGQWSFFSHYRKLLKKWFSPKKVLEFNIEDLRMGKKGGEIC